MDENKKIVAKKDRKKQLFVLALAGVLGCGGILGASAFFTDKEVTQATATVGNFNMTVTDLSDLDGQYSSWGTDGSQTKVLTTTGKQTADARGAQVDGKNVYANAKDKDNPSTGIINPGDTGIFQYEVENTSEKSMDTAKTVKVTVALKAGSTDTINKAEDASVYTIDGLGTPAIVMGADNKSMTLYYAMADTDVLDGSIEKDSGVTGGQTSMIYAYNADFNRLAKNKFQGLKVTVDTTVYAKQHRNSLDSTLKTNPAATGDTDAFIGTGDWQEIGSFEHVA